MLHAIQHRCLTVGILLAFPLLSNCATIVEGSDQTVTVLTEPPGAACILSRDDVTIGAANPTPATVSLEKSKDNIAIHCKKDGYFDGATAVASDFEAMTFGNILLGGIIGLAVDAASGATHEYPESVSIVLVPEEFPNAEVRDEFLDRQRARINSETDEAARELSAACDNSTQNCEALQDALERARDHELEELDTRLSASRIANP